MSASPASADEQAAFDEYAAAKRACAGGSPDDPLTDWREVLAESPAEASVRAFVESAAAARRIDDAVEGDVQAQRLREQICSSLVFVACYGKAPSGQPLSFDAALTRVLDEVQERLKTPRCKRASFAPGVFGAAHKAIRAAAYPYTPACATGKGSTTIDVSDDSGSLLGYVCVDLCSGYLDDLSILPSYQGQGLARGLVIEAAKALDRHGVATISLHVRAANHPARQLYAAIGLTCGENEYPGWYDWKGGFHLEAPCAEVAARERLTAPAPPPATLPEFVSLFPSVAAAFGGSRAQTGASNCGATAVSTCLAALGVREEAGSAGVVVRARDYSTRSLLTYLKSRANAGCTADDLVEGVRVLTAGRCVAKFFATGPSPPEGVCAWLAEWVALGAAPIATINTQLDGADYWHHQAVLGVKPHAKRVLLANPAEEVDEAELARLLGSDSVMLVMHSDVLDRCPPPHHELEQMRSLPEWSRMQVAEQVEALLADGASRSAEASRPAERLAIPASYTPGLTLIACAGSEAARRMEAGAGADCMRGLGGGA